MREMVVGVPDEAAQYFIDHFGMDDIKMLGFDVTGEIIRCKDCKNKQRYDEPIGCDCLCGLFLVEVESNGFCAWGEKKNEQQEDLAVGEFSVSHDNGKTYSAPVRYDDVRGEA